MLKVSFFCSEPCALYSALLIADVIFLNHSKPKKNWV